MPALAFASSIADVLPQPVWTTLPDISLSSANPSWCTYTGLDAGASLGTGWLTAVHPDDCAALIARHGATDATGSSADIEIRLRRSDGVWRWHLVRVAPIRDPDGAIISWVGTATDIDERRQAEEELRASEVRTRAIIEHAGDLVYTLDLDGTITAINPAIDSVLGYRPDEVIGQSVDSIIAPENLAFQDEVLKRKLAGEELSTYDVDLIAKDGRRVTLEVNSRLALVDGRPVAIYGVARDVSARRAIRAERRARERQAYLSASIGTTLTARLPLLDQLQRCAEALVVHLDATMARIWTLAEDDLTLVLRAHAGIDAPFDGHGDRIAIGTGRIGQIAATRTPDLTDVGEHVGVGVFAGYPLLVGERVVGVVDMFTRQPISEPTKVMLASVADAIAVGIERSRAETAREAALARERDSRARAEETATILATVNRVGQLLTAELDLERLVQTVTDVATELTGAHFGAFFYNLIDERGESYTLYALAGVSPESFAGYPMPRNTAIFGPTFRGEGIVRLADVRLDPRYGQNAPYSGTPPGHLPVVSYLAVPVISRSGEVHGGLFFGHPEAGVFDARAEDIAVGLAAHTAIAIDNARLYRDAQTAESRYRGLFAGVGDAILVADESRRYLDANHAAETLVGYSRAELVERRVEDIVARTVAWTEHEFADFQQAGHWKGEVELRRKDGSIVIAEAQATIIETPQGAVHISALRDVSERKAVEEQRQAFLEAVSHDLRNPLLMLRGQAQLARRRLRRGTNLDPDAVDASFAIIESASQRMDRQLDELQDVVRLHAGQLLELQTQATDLLALVTAAITEAQAISPRHQLTHESLESDLIGVWDSLRLRRVIDNLLGNAVKYSPDGGSITVAVTRETRTDGTWAVLTIRDEGVGIPFADLPHIFERYRRGSNVGWRTRGTGIGLAGVRQIVEQHGGAVSVESIEGHGSIFTVSLPLQGT